MLIKNSGVRPLWYDEGKGGRKAIHPGVIAEVSDAIGKGLLAVFPDAEEVKPKKEKKEES